MNEKIKLLVRQYETKGDFTYAIATETQLQDAERALGVSIPGQYRDFLMEYGHGGIGGVEVLGIGKTGAMLFVTETLKYRGYGLPPNLIVLENCDEWVYCLDCSNGSVKSWSVDSADFAYGTFDEYIEDRFCDAIDNL